MFFCSVSGRGILSGHADGTIVRFFFDDEGSGESQVSKILLKWRNSYFHRAFFPAPELWKGIRLWREWTCGEGLQAVLASRGFGKHQWRQNSDWLLWNTLRAVVRGKFMLLCMRHKAVQVSGKI